MWQQLTVEPGARYSFRTLVDNIPVYGGFSSVNNHYGTIGIDFFDASWNEIADVRLDANGPRLTDFVVPAETQFATVWVWTPPAISCGRSSNVSESIRLSPNNGMGTAFAWEQMRTQFVMDLLFSLAVRDRCH